MNIEEIENKSSSWARDFSWVGKTGHTNRLTSTQIHRGGPQTIML